MRALLIIILSTLCLVAVAATPALAQIYDDVTPPPDDHAMPPPDDHAMPPPDDSGVFCIAIYPPPPECGGQEDEGSKLPPEEEETKDPPPPEEESPPPIEEEDPPPPEKEGSPPPEEHSSPPPPPPPPPPPTKAEPASDGAAGGEGEDSPPTIKAAVVEPQYRQKEAPEAQNVAPEPENDEVVPAEDAVAFNLETETEPQQQAAAVANDEEAPGPAVIDNLAPVKSGTGNLLAILGLVAAVGSLLLARLVQGVRGRPTLRSGSTSDGVAKRATDAGADAARDFAEGRAAAKADGAASSGGGEGVLAETAPDPGTQPADSTSGPVLAGWVPRKRVPLLIADSHQPLRGDLRDVLESQPDFEVVGEATTGTEAVELAQRLHPKVVLMDLRIPEMDAVTATARIKSRHPDVSVLVLTTYDSDTAILAAVEEGATGYLLKDTPREELFRAIRAAVQGQPLPTSAVAARPIEQMQGPAEEAEPVE